MAIIRSCRCGRDLGGIARGGHDSGCTPDRGSGPESTWNLGNLVNDLKQVSKLTGRRIRTNVYRITDARRFPRVGIEPACRAHADPFHLDAQLGGLSVNVIEHAASRCEVEKMAASEIGFNRDAFRCPSVREADGKVGVGPHRPSGYCNLEPIVHQPLPLTPRNFRPGLHPDILTCRDQGCLLSIHSDGRTGRSLASRLLKLGIAAGDVPHV